MRRSDSASHNSRSGAAGAESSFENAAVADEGVQGGFDEPGFEPKARGGFVDE